MASQNYNKVRTLAGKMGLATGELRDIVETPTTIGAAAEAAESRGGGVGAGRFLFCKDTIATALLGGAIQALLYTRACGSSDLAGAATLKAPQLQPASASPPIR